jgi:hypothetical protein
MLTAILFTSLVTATTTSVLLEKFRAEREETTKGSRETIGHVITQLNAIEERLEKLSVLENSTEEIKTELVELKSMRAEVLDLKDSLEGKK